MFDGEIESLTTHKGNRKGGEPDKFGNLFEGAWTIRQLLSLGPSTVTNSTPVFFRLSYRLYWRLLWI